MPKNLVVLTGAGISAESGIKTFRDSNGLWENHNILDVASPEGWRKNPQLVLDFYNKRRAQLLEVQPNPGHEILVELEKYFNVQIITQNVDDLHERAGSTNVIHLHGELLKVRSTQNPDYVVEWKTDINLGDTCPNGHQLRPNIVWFHEDVPEFDKAKIIAVNADIMLVIGTSLQVYPAASLVEYVRPNVPIIYIDPNPDIETTTKRFHIMPYTASEGMELIKEQLIGIS